MKTAYDVIITPLITEKNNELAHAKKYAFKVATSASKIEIGKSVEKLFDVKVKAVNIMNYKGKPKRAGKSQKIGCRADWKKAVVTLSEGSIDSF
jgi:large subunit ribosomal protein L23